MKKLNITFCSFPDFAGNAKALYEYMVKTYKDNMNYTWIVYNQESVDRLNNKGIKAILIGSEEFNKYIPKTNVFFTTHANLAGDKSKSKNAIYVELWHGIGPKPVGFLTKNISKKDSKWYDFLSETIDYIITTSSLFNLIFSASFRIKPERVLNLGLPLLDDVVYSQGNSNLRKIYGDQIDKYKKIIFYSPTFKKGCGRGLESNYNQNNILNLHPYDEQKLIDYLHTRKYLLLIKYHPSDEINYKQMNDKNIMYLDNKSLEKNDLNIDQILNSFDLLITDFSSLGLEFSFLDRPVIYLDTDYIEYYQNRGILLDNYNFWANGNTCNTIEDLINMIDNQIDTKVINTNKKAIFSELVDGGCDQICNFFFSSDFKLSNQVKRYNSKLLDTQKELIKINDNVRNLNNRIQYLEEKEQELASIKYSRSYKIANKISNFKRIIVKK